MLLLHKKDEIWDALLASLREIVRDHYVAPDITAKRLEDLGSPKTAALLREHLPTSKRARSADLGEVIATEVAESQLGFEVPIRRLRWKDGREMALRGDDLVGISRGQNKKLRFLKGESKSRAAMTSTVINEAAEALERDKGRPTRHSVLFVAGRLREKGNDKLATELEAALLQSFRGYAVEHLLFTLSGNNPKDLLSQHLEACKNQKRCRHAVGIRIKEHGKLITELYGGF